MRPTADAVTGTSRARIGHLETDVNGLWTAVRNLETKLGCMPTEVSTQSRSDQTKSEGGSSDKVNDDDSDSHISESSPTDPPAHLLQLFENGLLGSTGHRDNSPSNHVPSLHKARASSALLSLLPSREDMLIITAEVSLWPSLPSALFPMISFTKSGPEMLLQYDKLQSSTADPVAIAALLLSITLTVQQAPADTIDRVVKGIHDTSSFIKEVSDSVERTIISDDVLAGNLEGIETMLVFLRL